MMQQCRLLLTTALLGLFSLSLALFRVSMLQRVRSRLSAKCLLRERVKVTQQKMRNVRNKNLL